MFKEKVFFVVELCTLEEGLTAQLRTESVTDVENWDTTKRYAKIKTRELFQLLEL